MPTNLRQGLDMTVSGPVYNDRNFLLKKFSGYFATMFQIVIWSRHLLLSILLASEEVVFFLRYQPVMFSPKTKATAFFIQKPPRTLTLTLVLSLVLEMRRIFLYPILYCVPNQQK